MKKGFWIGLGTVIGLALCVVAVTYYKQPQVFAPYLLETIDRSEGGTKVAFFGDQGYGADAEAVLRLVKAENVDLVVHLGDFEYLDKPDLWREQIKKILGDEVPYLPVFGNHEEKQWDGYRKEVDSLMGKIEGLECEGDIGIDASCYFKGIHFVLSTPGLLGEKIGDARNLSHAEYIRDHFASSTDTWRVCAWHKNQHLMQVGTKADEVGWDIYEACRESGAIIATGHEHSYSRTYLLSDMSEQTVAATTSPFILKEGVSLVFVSGLGGKSIRPQEQEKGDWWGSVYTSLQDAKPGALFCTFGTIADPKKGKCEFKNIAGETIDSFEIVSGLGK